MPEPADYPSRRFAIDLRIADPAWKRALPGAPKLLRRAVRAVLAAEFPRGRSALALLISDDAEMKRLNREWRGMNKPTDVLSFPAEARVDPKAPPAYLGDIVLGLDYCRRAAKEQGKAFADHAQHLVVHGTLHLLGHDHLKSAEAARMERREIAILKTLGIADPYILPGAGKGARA